MFLYLTTDGLYVTKDGGRFIVKNPVAHDESEQQLPISLVEGMVIFGRIQLSTDVIRACLKGNIPVFFLSKRGSFFGKLDNLEAKNVELLYNHIQASLDPVLSLRYAKSILDAKIHNSRVMLQRRKRFYLSEESDFGSALDKLANLQKHLQNAENIAALRGIEWFAAKIYFETYGKCIPQPFFFTGRNRRPPRDPVNSLLSLGYTLLAQSIEMILNIQGIETQIGFIHQPKDLKSLLVLDMMEMFRAWIVDDLVLRLLINKKMSLDDFYVDEENIKRPVLLGDEGLKVVLEEYYKVIFKQKGISEIPYENDFIKLKIIEKTLESFKQSLVKQTHNYEGFKIK